MIIFLIKPFDKHLGLERAKFQMMEDSAQEYPVTVQPDGNIKLKMENMVVDKLYHCICEDKVYLFYKDENELLNCYEIEDARVVHDVKANPSELERILKSYSAK